MNFFFLEDTREGFASHADVLALERLRGRLAKEPQGAHTSSVSVYARNIKKCMGEY